MWVCKTVSKTQQELNSSEFECTNNIDDCGLKPLPPIFILKEPKRMLKKLLFYHLKTCECLSKYTYKKFFAAVTSQEIFSKPTCISKNPKIITLMSESKNGYETSMEKIIYLAIYNTIYSIFI